MAIFQKNKRYVMDLPIHSIIPNPNQPRQTFDPAAMEELSSSIAQFGVLQPLTVRKVENGWELIAGERRLRAAQLAGLATVPCLPLEADAGQSSLLALIENLQRRDLDVWEEAAALRQLIDRFSLSQEEVARRIGKSQSAVANKLRLLNLPEDIIQTLRGQSLTERHARALLRLGNPDLQHTALKYIIRGRLNVAQTEAYVEKLIHQRPHRTASPIYRTRDVRLFLNTIKRSLSIMQSAGVNVRCGQEETEQEIILTVHIPK